MSLCFAYPKGNSVQENRCILPDLDLTKDIEFPLFRSAIKANATKVTTKYEYDAMKYVGHQPLKARPGSCDASQMIS